MIPAWFPGILSLLPRRPEIFDASTLAAVLVAAKLVAVGFVPILDVEPAIHGGISPL